MATVTIRHLDDDIVAKLKLQARVNHRSLEAELRELLSSEVRKRERMKQFLDKADRITAMTPKVRQTDSTRLIREDRRR